MSGGAQSVTWSHGAAGDGATFISMQCLCGTPHAVELPADGVASVDCDCGRTISIRYGNPERDAPAVAAEPCPRCRHQSHDHGVVGVFAWCWECGRPCGKLRGHPKDSPWEVLRGLIQNDMDAGITATVHKVGRRTDVRQKG